MLPADVARLTAQGIIEKLPDGRYNQDASRLKYFAHLRSPDRVSARSQADAAFTAAKTRLVNLRVAERERELISLGVATTVLDAVIGLVLTKLSGMAARCTKDLQIRRTIDAVIHEIRVEISEAASKLADERGEPPEEAPRCADAARNLHLLAATPAEVPADVILRLNDACARVGSATVARQTMETVIGIGLERGLFASATEFYEALIASVASDHVAPSHRLN